MKNIAVLGCTGSIGRQTLDVIRANPDKFRAAVLCAGRDADAMFKAAEEFRPDYIAMAEEAAADKLRQSGIKAKIAGGEQAVLEAAAYEGADIIVNGISGFSGMKPLLAALEAGKTVALANKESIVCAHDLVNAALKKGVPEEYRRAVSMIVGRDTAELDDLAVTRAAVETVAENASDGVIAPMLFLALGGAPLGFFYKAANTMDSMLGYIEMPYKNIGLVPAKMDDVLNYIPARLSALLMLAAGALLGMDAKNGWRIWRRDRRNHASPNSAQTESVCAGLLGVRLAGDAYYHGELHKKPYIGDALREIEYEDIPRAGRLLYATAALSLVLFGAVRFLLVM